MTVDSSQNGKPRYIGFANARLPDTDYRVAFANSTDAWACKLVLPDRPAALETSKFIRLAVGEGISVRALAALLQIPLILRRERAQVAHFFATQYALAGPLLARLAGVPSVITVTGLGRSFTTSGLKGRLTRHLYMRLFAFAAMMSARVLFQNHDDLRMLGESVGPRLRAKFAWIGSGVDLERIEPQPVRDAGQMTKKPRVLYVGRVQVAKGMADWISVARACRREADFVVLGPLTNGDAAADMLLAEQWIDWRGSVSHPEVLEVMKEADLLLFPSYGEGMPRAVLEACATRVPVIAYDVPGCREALPDECLVPARDVAALERTVRLLLESQGERESLAQLGHEYVKAKFSAAAYVKRLHYHLEQLSESKVEAT